MLTVSQVIEMFPAESAEIVKDIEDVLEKKMQKNRTKTVLAAASSPPSGPKPMLPSPLEKGKSTVAITGHGKRRRSSISKMFNAITSSPSKRKVLPMLTLSAHNDMEEFGPSEEEGSPITTGPVDDSGSFDMTGVLLQPRQETSVLKRLWDSGIFFIIVYTYFMVPLRFAITINPMIYLVDYFIDAILIFDSFLNWTYWPANDAGKSYVLQMDIRRLYCSKFLFKDLIARFPYDIATVLIVGRKPQVVALTMKCLRLPKLLLIARSLDMFSQLESLLNDIAFPFLYLRICEVSQPRASWRVLFHFV
jgi:hypothetical protein